MTTMAFHEATTDADVQTWHDEAYAVYEAALLAYSEDCKARRASGDAGGFDPDLRAAYEEARDALQTGVVYWRQVGEAVGKRWGTHGMVATEDHVLGED